MTTWNFRNVPPELEKAVREEAKATGQSVRATVMLALCKQFAIGKLANSKQTASKLQAPSDSSTSREEKVGPDPRHRAVRELIMKCHLEAFKQECPWGADEAGQLGHLLRKVPGMTVGELEVCVRNRFRSEGIAPDSPRVWLSNLTRYGAGPLDKFGKTKRVMKAAPVEYMRNRYSAETMEKIRLANLDDESKEKAN